MIITLSQAQYFGWLRRSFKVEKKDIVRKSISGHWVVLFWKCLLASALGQPMKPSPQCSRYVVSMKSINLQLGVEKKAPPIPDDVLDHMSSDAKDFLDKCFTMFAYDLGFADSIVRRLIDLPRPCCYPTLFVYTIRSSSSPRPNSESNASQCIYSLIELYVLGRSSIL